MGGASGIFYGSINVLSKPFVAHPLWKAAVAYLASATVLSPFLRGLHMERRDWPNVLAMGLIGGGLAPILLFYGLRETAAADAGLLLTLELVTTTVLAVIFLGERFRPGEGLGLAFLLASAAIIALAVPAQAAAGSTLRGAALVLGAAVCWGIDNTASARLVGSYRPRSLIALKGLLGGTACLAAALITQAPVPHGVDAAAMAGLGILAIAFSSLLFYTALQRVGASRTSAMNIAFTALIGAAGGAFVLGEHLRPMHAVAVAAVLVGSVLLARTPTDAAPVAAMD
jgi:drug/metabolite transporter (DMT)-like permease